MSKKIVAYFSVGGKTKQVAGVVAEKMKAEEFEIVPTNPYTNADIRWINPLARCNKEKVKNADVEYVGKIENIDEYDVIVIGFPIWYYREPNIIDTFLKDYDLSGKKVALFATSGGSDISKAVDRIKTEISSSIDIVGAKLFKTSDEAIIGDWVNSLNLGE